MVIEGAPVSDQKAQDNWKNNDIVSDPLLCAPNALPVNHPQIEERLLWHFTSDMYYDWFHNGTGHFPEAERELEEGYGEFASGVWLTTERISAATVAECERLEVEAKQKDEELRQLQAQEVRSPECSLLTSSHP